MFGIGFSEMLILAIIALLVFGPKRLPEIGGAVGKGMREFKQAVNGESTAVKAQENTPVAVAAVKAENDR